MPATPDQPDTNDAVPPVDSRGQTRSVLGESGLHSGERPSVSPNSIEGLFLQALQLGTSAERDGFLREVCGGDAERLKRVTALLRAYDDAGSFLETPVGGARGETGKDISLSFLKPAAKDGVLGTIGPYEVLEVIGRGGMGVVLRAVDPKLNRVVAVKALLPELAANPNARRRFLREAQAAAAISHPHVVTIHAVDDVAEPIGEKPVPPYLVMECVVGQSLQQKLDRVGPLRLAEILRISRQVGEGLAAAHRQGVIHRDIKPANILLENGVERVKITDFGLARAIDDITVTRTGEVAGTPQYMSPEQASGERVDHRSDLFSLGCVMYAMCTGHSPFRGDSIAHVIKRVTQDSPRPIAEQNPEIPSWLTDIINSLLQKNAEYRFQSADGLVAILDQHLSRVQHPTESGSHSAINQQVPFGNAVAAQREPKATGQSVPKLSALSFLEQSPQVLVPTLMRLTSRIFTVVCMIVWMLFGLSAMEGLTVGMVEFFIVSFLNLGPILMAIILSRPTVTREVMAIALFLGLGPLGLLIYLWIKDHLKVADSSTEHSSPQSSGPPVKSHAHEILSPLPNPLDLFRGKSRSQKQETLGVLLIGLGATVLFGLVAWVLLVTFEVIGASYEVRSNAMGIAGICIFVTFLCWFAGLLLRKQIQGHETIIDLLKLAGCILLGPIGIYLWVSHRLSRQQQVTLPQPVSPSAPVVKSPWSPLIRMLTLLIGLVLAFIFLIVVMIAIPAFLSVFARTGSQLVIHHTADVQPGTVTIGDQVVRPMSQDESHTVVAGLREGEQSVSISVPRKNGVTETVTRTVRLSRHKPAEIDLRLPIQFHTGGLLGPANADYGGLILEIVDPGLHVMLLSHGPGFLGFYPDAIPAGQHRIPVGKYSVVILDSHAGRLEDVRSHSEGDYPRIYETISRTFGTSKPEDRPLFDSESGTWGVTIYSADEPLEIKPGEFATAVARRNIQRIALSGQPTDRTGPERFVAGSFHRFLWNDQKFSFSAPQAKVVNALLQAYADGKPEVAEQELIALSHSPNVPAATSLQSLFNDGKHPAWEQLFQITAEGDSRKFALRRLDLDENNSQGDHSRVPIDSAQPS